MATANSTSARRAPITPSIAPTFPQSPADRAAHRAAEYRRGDSDPSMDEALRRVQTELAYLERAAQLLAEDNEWAEDVAA